jgi:hydrogenase expression/formation protein HypE
MNDISPIVHPIARRRRGALSADTVTLAHGGGKAIKDLIDDVFVSAFDNPLLEPLDDQARMALSDFALHGNRLAFTTGSYVVDPLFFPGGDIGELAVCGTVNNLAVGGATPLYLSCAAIIEEGCPVALLRRVARSMAAAAREAGVKIVTGDTKVVHRGACDKLFLTTSGVGAIKRGVELDPTLVQAGDAVLVNGMLGDHGATILAARGDLAFADDIESDCAPLNGIIQALLTACPATRFLRDATRGGVATVLNEIAQAAVAEIVIAEEALPIREAVRGMCEILGLDPLYLANQGKVVAIVPAEDAECALATMRAHPLGAGATMIGRVSERAEGRVLMRKLFGGTRAVEMPIGDQLPRSC